MTIVTLAEASENLADLISRANTGEEFVITDNGKSVAQLVGRPAFPVTPEEEAARQAGAEEGIRSIVQMWIDNGHPPPPDSPLWEIMGRRP